MLILKKITPLVLVCSILGACAKEAPSKEELRVENHKQIELSLENNERLLEAGVSLKSVEPEGIENKGLDVISKNLCSYLSDGDAILKDRDVFREGLPLERYAEYFKSLRVRSCEFSEVMVNHYPFSFLEFKIESSYVYASITYDSDYKIIALSFLPFSQKIFMKRLDLKARDGELLTTYVLGNGDGSSPKGVVFNRSPYMSYGSFLFQASVALDLGYNYVVQANRGTHTSTGVFRWLDPVDNANDAEDSIKWIRRQSFSNGRVVSYGVSYDGFNALASTLNKPEGLIGVISCSSPANAATDSLSAGKQATTSLLTYVTNRDDLSQGDPSSAQLQTAALFVDKKQRALLDEYTIGIDSEEWNLINEAHDNINHPYWVERSLYKKLEDVDVPIFHIAGLTYDQDGKDTFLLYEHLESNSLHKEKHYLGVHPKGHGCGSMMNARLFKNFIHLAGGEASREGIEKSPRVMAFKGLIRGYEFSDEYNPAKSDFALTEDLIVEDISVIEGRDASRVSAEAVFIEEVQEDRILNGLSEIELSYTLNAPEVSLHATLYVVDSKGEFKSRIMTATTVLEGALGVEQKVRLPLPPSIMLLSKGDSVRVYFSSFEQRFFMRTPESKEDKSLFPKGAGVKILAGTKLLLPLEEEALPLAASF